MSKKHKRKNKANKNNSNKSNSNCTKKKRSSLKKKYKNNILLGFLYITTKILMISFKFIFSKVKENKIKRKKSKDYDHKVFSHRCLSITASIIVLSTLFVYLEGSLLYAYPILTCIIPFMMFSEGINLDINNKYKDLPLYNKILKLNTISFFIIYAMFNKELWFINAYMVLIFIIPFAIGNFKKEYNEVINESIDSSNNEEVVKHLNIKKERLE